VVIVGFSVISKGSLAALTCGVLIATLISVVNVRGVGPSAGADAPCNPVPYAAADGSLGDPFVISQVGHLLYLASTSASEDWNKHFQQTADLNLAGCDWTPIGTPSVPFAGTYDGGRNMISNLVVTGNQQIGLFGRVADATISALNLHNVSVAAAGTNGRAGALIGQAGDGTNPAVVTISHVTGSAITVQGRAQVGGLVGYVQLGVTATFSDVRLTDVDIKPVSITPPVESTRLYFGGVVGWISRALPAADVMFSDVHVSGSVTGSADRLSDGGVSASGGLVGGFFSPRGKATFERVSFVGTVDGFGGSAGGLLGTNAGVVTSITSAYVSAEISSSDDGPVGGLIGTNRAGASSSLGTVTIRDVTSMGTVSGSSAVGGLIGRFDASVSVSAVTRTGMITADADRAGGVVGELTLAGTRSLTVSDFWSDSDVEAPSQVGGVVGSLSTTSATPQAQITGVHLLGAFLGSDSVSDGFVGCWVGNSADDGDSKLKIENSFGYGSKAATTAATPVMCQPTQLTPPSAPVRYVPLGLPAPDFGNGSDDETDTGADDSGASNETSTPVGTEPTAPPSTVAEPVTTEPTAPPSTVAEPVTTDGVLPSLPPGEIEVWIDGVAVPVEVTVENSSDLVLRGNGFELRLSGQCAAECTIETTPDGRQALRIDENGFANVSGEGFLADSLVYVWLFSEPTFLGQLEVNADGVFAGTTPLGAVAPGEHTLQVNGTSTDGRVLTANLGVIVDQSPASLPVAGVDPARLWVLGLGLLALGMILVRRRPQPII